MGWTNSQICCIFNRVKWTVTAFNKMNVASVYSKCTTARALTVFSSFPSTHFSPTHTCTGGRMGTKKTYSHTERNLLVYRCAFWVPFQVPMESHKFCLCVSPWACVYGRRSQKISQLWWKFPYLNFWISNEECRSRLLFLFMLCLFVVMSIRLRSFVHSFAGLVGSCFSFVTYTPFFRFFPAVFFITFAHCFPYTLLKKIRSFCSPCIFYVRWLGFGWLGACVRAFMYIFGDMNSFEMIFHFIVL